MTTTTQFTHQDFARALKRGEYAWPGGYPTYFITSDCAALCFDCAKKEAKRIVESIRNGSNDGWRVIGHEVNWEDSCLICDHCSQRIESAYAED